VRKADKFYTSKCLLSLNLEASTALNPQGLSKPVMGLLYLQRIVSRTLRKLDIHGSMPYDTIYENDEKVVTLQDNLLFLECSTCFER
jgi:hypothetical protein